MAFRMKRSAPNAKEKESIRKKRKLNTLFDIDDVANLSKKAEISASKSLTADEKRIEIGKRILAAAKESVPDSDEDDDDDLKNADEAQADMECADDDDDENEKEREQEKARVVHEKLMRTIGEKEGKFRYQMAKKVRDHISKHKSLDCGIKVLRGHRLAVTCMAVDPTGKDRYVLTGSKDGSIIKWELATGKKVRKVWHAWPINNRNKVNRKTGKKLKWGGLRYEVYKKVRPKAVLALAISPDEKWMVSAGEDCLIRVWNAQTLRFKSTFRGGHRAKITGLAFARNDNKSELLSNDGESNNTLFSTGADRQIRVYDMNEMGFAEPLYGHTMAINCIDATNEDRCITVSDDKTIRYWKLRTQSQLIFSDAHSGCIDACCYITPGRFVTGSQDGSIALWTPTKKHALHKQSDAHLSTHPLHGAGDAAMRHWVCSLGARPNNDVFASGSSDGVLKLWALRNQQFHHLRSIQIEKGGGFVNVIKWTNDARRIICGLGNEHRLGRWYNVQGAKNGIAIIKLPVGCMDDEQHDANAEQEEDGLQYQTANTWDKWNPKERGECVQEDKQKQKKNEKEEEQDQGEGDEDLDKEWTSFFGNVFST